MPREITSHRDGHGLLDSMRVFARDELGPGGAHHHYLIEYPLSADGRLTTTIDVHHQKGPRHEPGSEPGILDPVLLAIVRDRLECFQRGPYASPENAVALDHVIRAMQAFKDRADRRANQGVLGTHAPDPMLSDPPCYADPTIR